MIMFSLTVDRLKGVERKRKFRGGNGELAKSILDGKCAKQSQLKKP